MISREMDRRNPESSPLPTAVDGRKRYCYAPALPIETLRSPTDIATPLFELMCDALDERRGLVPVRIARARLGRTRLPVGAARICLRRLAAATLGRRGRRGGHKDVRAEREGRSRVARPVGPSRAACGVAGRARNDSRRPARRRPPCRTRAHRRADARHASAFDRLLADMCRSPRSIVMEFGSAPSLRAASCCRRLPAVWPTARPGCVEACAAAR